MARKIEVAITGDARSLERAFRQSGRSADSFGKKITRGAGAGLLFLGKTAAVGAAAGLAVTTVGLVKAAKAASESEASTARLNQQLKTLGKDNDSVRASIDQTVTSLSNLSGFDDEDLQDAFTSLVRSSGNVELSMSNLGIATDIAASGTMSLEAATKLLNRVNAGSVTALKRYGIEVDKNTTKQEALRLLQQKFAGQAEAFGQTAAGAQARLAVAFENAFEEIGVALTPVIADLANLATEYLPGIARSVSQYLGAAKDEILEFVDAFRIADGIEGKARLVFEIGKDAIMDLVNLLVAQLRKVNWKDTGQAILAGVVAAATTANVAFNEVTKKIAQSIIDNIDVVAEAGALVALAVVDRLMDPGFWIRHWPLVLTVALSALPIGRVTVIGAKVAQLFIKPLLKIAAPFIRPFIAAFDQLLKRIGVYAFEAGFRFVDRMEAALTSLRGRITGALMGTVGAAESALQRLVNFGSGVFMFVEGTLRRVLRAVSLALISLTRPITYEFRQLLIDIELFFVDGFARIVTRISSFVFKIEREIAYVAARVNSAIRNMMQEIVNIIADRARDVVAAFDRGMANLVENAARLATRVVYRISTGIFDGIDNIRTAAIALANAFVRGVEAAWDRLPGIVRALIRFSVANTIVNLVEVVLNAAKELGRAAIDGITQGVREKAEALKNTLSGVVKDAVAFVKRNVLNSSSPSKWTMAQLGFPMIDGVVEGVKGRRAILRQTLGDVFKNAVDAARSQVSSLSGILGSMLDKIGAQKVGSMVSAGALTGGKTLAEIRSEQARVEREREKARLKKAVNDAQSDEERQQALQDLSDWEINEEARLLEEKMALAEKSYADDIANLQDSFDRGLISAETFKTELEKIVGAETGKLLGEQFAAAFGQTLTTLITTLSNLAAAGVGGEGLTPISPIGAVQGATAEYAANKARYDAALKEWDDERIRRRDRVINARSDAKKAGSRGGTIITEAEKAEIEELERRLANHMERKPKPGDFGLQRGGIVMSPIQTWLGENNQSEAVIPLDSGRGQRMLKTALSAGGGMSAGDGVTINVTVNGNEFSAAEFARKIAPELRRQVTLIRSA